MDKAEEMALNALTIEEEIGHVEGIANQYANLGFIWATRLSMDRSVNYFTKAADLFEQMGLEKKVEEMEGWIALVQGHEPDKTMSGEV